MVLSAGEDKYVTHLGNWTTQPHAFASNVKAFVSFMPYLKYFVQAHSQVIRDTSA